MTEPRPAASGLVEEVASVLRERIYAGRLAPGERLRQEGLAGELGVSRTPLREAIRQLEQDGLLRVDPRNGARVVSGDRDTLLQAYELRAVVDGLAARLAARARPGAGRIRELRAILAAQRAALDPWEARTYTAANVDFHEHLLHLSGNEFLLDRAPLLRMTAQVFTPVALIDPAGARRAVTEHTAIVGAVEAGDEAAAERLARAHIETTIEQLRGDAAHARR
ncbi:MULTISPECIES: GntR family transcriptional regulator [Pseudonocardia]|uniref:GntR family transcriptional regulator n=2 Tax=Pseudonocardia TaxID=1847 RepID=A0ABQ0S323_9PSEU|nr:MULTISPECIES: GntR family transcriptional regulator [Pseudonocardia]OSY37749.1 putative HTH-type transcriptional regulator YdfH [Pseudonocardia autotrophica]TDN75761.1 GntR family transcriptional regulator [Pseudonocardia autotrophica]BBF99731.1 GntR family transcriptional regulator [Pseudonocardia autotrophica]GEC27178.1 GntR family transcriptional regulator [Pseudonocardia saturnea]